MSLDYRMLIAGISLPQARSALLELHGFREYSAEPNPRRQFQTTHIIHGPGIIMWLDDAKLDQQAQTWHPFVLNPDVEWLLEADKFADPVRVGQTIVMIVRKLLQNASGDALFFFTQSHRPLLHRRDGIVLIDDDPKNFWLWNPSTLEMLGLDHSLTSLSKW